MAEQGDVHPIPTPGKTRAVVEDLLHRQTDARDREIDQPVHQLDGVTDEEIATVEGGDVSGTEVNDSRNTRGWRSRPNGA
jgi:hypothetical protein